MEHEIEDFEVCDASRDKTFVKELYMYKTNWRAFCIHPVHKKGKDERKENFDIEASLYESFRYHGFLQILSAYH